MFPISRPRRLRSTPFIRELVRETSLEVNDLICPIFIRHDNKTIPIKSMPGYSQLSLDALKNEIDIISELGLRSVILFGIPESKDEIGSDSCHENGIIQRAIRKIKEHNPNLLVIADTCFCEYTSHGHCGVIEEINGKRDVDNDKTLALLAKQALSFAQAGADIIAPSGNMDGMVDAIRTALDHAEFSNLPILSYSIKYASSLYGPFREAAEGAPQFGDRKTYQMDCANAREALREAAFDIEEGADMLMVKPALAYLDIIRTIKNNFPEYPLGAYQVSGEYAMIKAAAQNNWIDETKVMMETLLSIKRAGADFIISYFSKEAARVLHENQCTK